MNIKLYWIQFHSEENVKVNCKSTFSPKMQESHSFLTKTLQLISVNLVKYGSDPNYILLKNLAVCIQSKKAFYIGCSTI